MLDLLIKQGRLVNQELVDIAVQDGTIVEVAAAIDADAKQILDLKGETFVSAGWIDDHVHCYEKMTLYYDIPDKVGVETGVATIIDAGTTGAENIRDFYEIAKDAKTNVYALLNISKWGIVEQDELADLEKVKEALVTEALTDLPEFIVGIKARMSKTVIGENGILPLDLAKKIQRENNDLPLMVHIGSAPPTLEEILERLETGDVLTHCFNGKPNGILDQTTDKIKDFVWKAYRRGIVFDTGHGTDSFNFHVAEVAWKEGMKATSISTDIYHRNRKNGPVFDLATSMEKMFVLGYTWEEIIERVTAVPAANFNLTTKGQLKAGFDADITLFSFSDGDKTLTDSNGNTRTTTQMIQPVATIVGGKIYDI